MLSRGCLLLWLGLAAGLQCRRETTGPQPSRFYFAGACVLSKMTLVAASYSPTLQTCSAFAFRKRGLAINFLNRDLLYPLAKNYSKETCLVFDCPEFDVQISLEIDSLYDYYSTYARPMPNRNVTCVPRLGVFQIHSERLNFTDAEDVCESENGSVIKSNSNLNVMNRASETKCQLADISNGPRTVQLASILSKEHVKLAYIGMAQEEGRFITPDGFLLDCLAYRAWAPGHPRKGFKCAALSDKGLWVSYECKKRLPFLCELKQSGPLSPCINLPSEWRQECRKTFIRSFPTPKRNPRCGDPQIDENTFRLPLLQTNNITTTNQTTTEKQNVTQLKPQRKLPN